MCGLCGFAFDDPRRVPQIAELLSMARTLEHRGPDDQGALVLGSAGLGFRRLSIIDLAGGHQPFTNETGEIALVGNGEIFNHHELRRGLLERGHGLRTRSDIETLVHLYEEHGPAFARQLVGQYAFALIDRRGGRLKLVLGRDHLGIKPLYYARTAGGLCFASEPKAILQREELARELRPEALLEYLVSGYIGGELAAWNGMRRLPPASTLVWEPGSEPRVERYWDLPLVGLREPASREELLEQLDRVVAEQLEAEVPLGAFLSGGIDSNAVVASMVRTARGPVIACSVGFQEKSHDELELARRSAAALGVVQRSEVLRPDPKQALEVLPWFFDEPLADPSTLPSWLVSSMARRHVTVALSGDGGDEVFGGYRRYVHDWAENRLRERVGRPGRALARFVGPLYPKLDWAPRFLRGRTFLTNLGDDPARAYWRSVSILGRSEALALLHPDLRARLGSYDPFERFCEHYQRPQGVDALYRAQYADVHTYLPDQILTKADRASMAASLELRPPLLDHRFVERFINLPAAEKVQGGRGKHALREALRGRVLDEVLDGKKRGFDIPLAAWTRGPLAPALAEALASLPAEWFDRAALRACWLEHQSGGRDHSRVLWSLLVLEHWRRRHAVRGLCA